MGHSLCALERRHVFVELLKIFKPMFCMYTHCIRLVYVQLVGNTFYVRPKLVMQHDKGPTHNDELILIFIFLTRTTCVAYV